MFSICWIDFHDLIGKSYLAILDRAFRQNSDTGLAWRELPVSDTVSFGLLWREDVFCHKFFICHCFQFCFWRLLTPQEQFTQSLLLSFQSTLGNLRRKGLSMERFHPLISFVVSRVLPFFQPCRSSVLASSKNGFAISKIVSKSAFLMYSLLIQSIFFSRAAGDLLRRHRRVWWVLYGERRFLSSPPGFQPRSDS